MVAEDKGNDEEGHAEEHSDTGDEMDEVVDFLRDGGLARVQTRSQASNTTHDLAIKSKMYCSK